MNENAPPWALFTLLRMTQPDAARRDWLHNVRKGARLNAHM